MKLLVFWYCDSFCDCQMLCLVGLYDPAKTYLGIFWRIIMFGCYSGTYLITEGLYFTPFCPCDPHFSNGKHLVSSLCVPVLLMREIIEPSYLTRICVCTRTKCNQINICPKSSNSLLNLFLST